MAEAAEVVAVLESKASPEVQAEAEALGWIPPSRFKGDPARFTDAEAYIEKGKEVLPILRATNEKLRNELVSVRKQSAETAAALKAAQTAIDNIEERHSAETARAVARARKDVKAQLAAASEAGDHAGVAELTDQLTQLNAVDTAAPPAKKAADEPKPQVEIDPELQRWVAEKAPWYGTDRRKTGLINGIASEMRAGGETSVGRVFLDKLMAEYDKETAPRRPPAIDRSEGGRNGSGNETRGAGGAKNFDSLPADAKAACTADTRKFVGAGKKYANAAEYHENWARIYYSQE